MSRKWNCLDNSPIENFFGRMKVEMWYNQECKYKNSTKLIKGIQDYIKYYNEDRIVLKLKSSPIEYRTRMLKTI
ncbi:IS3 family transposase [Anaerorhabdus furcosa]|uniref:IS3 family transposase n=1 Tax=Anaerorhabdus furcosa TaxID=118967 RepID=UPI003CCA2D00